MKKFLGTLWIRKSIFEEEIYNVDEKKVVRYLLVVEKERKLGVTSELEKITLMEEISWQQKSRTLWLKEGDKCTKFFHKVANSHRRNNAIEILVLEGNGLSRRQNIKDQIVLFYERLLTEQYSW